MLESLKPTFYRTSHLGEQLVTDGLLTLEQLQDARTRQAQSNKRLGETLLQMGLVGPKVLGRYLEAATRCQFVELTDFPIDQEIARAISELRARKLQALPIKDRGSDLLVAMSDPLNLSAVDELAAITNRRITPVLAFENDLNTAINRIFDVSNRAQGIIEQIRPDDFAWQLEEDTDDLASSADDAPVVQLVNSLIAGAIASEASDIHIEPQKGSVRVRFRIDGMLYDQMATGIPTLFRAAVASRIKIMARCNIAERRRPQDGRILYSSGGRDNDLRVSIMPTVFGEKIAIRILERETKQANLEQMGFFPDQFKTFETFFKRPYGMVLVTGPTGSGKSTTLHAVLSKINNPNINISTVEDPVEYVLPGVNQMQVDPRINVTFASGLRTLVRQDPDVIMVGEIRDPETAEIAVQSALTGHLVFSTLHTNDAPGAITRLMNMGVEPYLIASALLCVVGQRLVRTICPNCREDVPASQTALEALGIPYSQGFMTTLAAGRGCQKCGQRGMKGRTAVYEIMPVTEVIREQTLRRASSAEIRDQAIREGMMTMRDSAVRKVLQGITTLEEITRVLVVEE